jgi:hypothetical protein
MIEQRKAVTYLCQAPSPLLVTRARSKNLQRS